jgi:hypothetical protein
LGENWRISIPRNWYPIFVRDLNLRWYALQTFTYFLIGRALVSKK